jgi:hypothetical protein
MSDYSKVMTDTVQNKNNNKSVWPCSKEMTTVTPSLENSLKRRAMVQFVIMLAIALLFLFVFKKPIAGGIVFSLAVIVLISGLFAPSFFLSIEHFGKKLGLWVANGLTWLLLVPFYYLCFLPGRILLSISGKDPLNLKFHSKADTYWVSRKPAKDLEQYEKQH